MLELYKQTGLPDHYNMTARPQFSSYFSVLIIILLTIDVSYTNILQYEETLKHFCPVRLTRVARFVRHGRQIRSFTKIMTLP